jgi:hypothetical protein
MIFWLLKRLNLFRSALNPNTVDIPEFKVFSIFLSPTPSLPGTGGFFDENLL